jgi:hypothetical protein
MICLTCDDVVTVAVLGAVGGAVLLVALAAGFWYSKSRHRHVERLERRNSIRQSLHSIRSVGLASSQVGFTEIGIRRKPASVSFSLFIHSFIHLFSFCRSLQG